jgi:hypothetical protein
VRSCGLAFCPARATVSKRWHTPLEHPAFEVGRVDADAGAELHRGKLTSLDGAANRQMFEANLLRCLLHGQEGRADHAIVIT